MNDTCTCNGIGRFGLQLQNEQKSNRQRNAVIVTTTRDDKQHVQQEREGGER